MIHLKEITPLKARREELKISQELLARKVEVPAQTIRNYEDWKTQFKQFLSCIEVAHSLEIINKEDPSIKKLLAYFKA